MEIALLVGLSILLAISLAAGPFCYSYYIYSKNRIFIKTKLPKLIVILCAFLVACFLGLTILFSIKNQVKYANVYVILTSILLALSTGYLIMVCIIPTLTNKNKIEFDQISNIDWQQKYNELKAQVPDMEALKTKLAKSNKKYYTSMLEYYEHILKNAKNENISLTQKLADIGTFNEAFSHKWSAFLNNFQLSLTYQYLMFFQKIQIKNNF